MTRHPRPARTTTDTVLVALTFTGLIGGSLVRILDGPVAVSAALTGMSLVAGAWAAWRMYDREPDGHRGE